MCTKTIHYVNLAKDGVNNMSYTKQVNSFADNLVFHYAKQRSSGFYKLDINEISDFELNDFAHIIMSSDEGLASEATGPDNPAYQKAMLPALITYLKDTTDKDNEILFNKIWREGVTSYFYNIMQELIDEHCNDRIHNEDSLSGFYNNPSVDRSEMHWRGY